jgi:2-methylcitrate dehydratase PrpD
MSTYAAARLSNPTIRSLMAVTDCYRDPSLDADYPKRWPAAASVELKDGRVLSTRVEFATGEPENSVPRDALVAKFVSLAERPDAESLAASLLALDSAEDLSAIDATLSLS